MKAMLAASLMLSLGVHAYAVTDEDKFKKLLNQSTVAIGAFPSVSDVVQKAKAACVCMGEEVANKQTGVLARRTFGTDQVSFLTSCIVPTFGTDGTAVAFFECFDWELLAGSPTGVPGVAGARR
jgi:hypothetical protein